MKLLGAALVLTLAVLLGHPAIAAQAPKADISGLWAATFDTPVGEMKYSYEFTVAANGTLMGTAEGPFGKSALTEGSVKADNVTFVEMLDGAIKVTYSGTIVSKDEIKFSRVVGDFGTEEAVARRNTPPAR